MKVLVFDTETTGVKKSDDMKAPHDHVIQLAARLVDLSTIPEYGTPIKAMCSLSVIINQGVDVPEGAFKVHGIDRNRQETYGLDPEDVAHTFAGFLDKSEAILGHNVTFDIGMMRHFYHDNGFEGDPFGNRPVFDSMKVSTNICRIRKPSGSGYKWPKLIEAHRFFTHWEEQRLNPDYNAAELNLQLDAKYENAHDALIDTDMSLDVFFSYCRFTGQTFGLTNA